MTNETTASQPKSIGDDAQFRLTIREMVRLLEAKEWPVAVISEDADAQALEVEIACLISALATSRAPAAQASATIQAAPIGWTAKRVDGTGYGNILYSDRQSAEIAVSHNGPAAPKYEIVPVFAATIQEPVMVAEPKSVPMKEIGEILAEVMQIASNNGANSVTMPDAYVAVAHFTCYPQEYGFAAPMVADPAGVVVTDDRERFEALTLQKYAAATFERFTYGKYKTTWVQDHYEGWCMALAATVKAVPSEAPAKRNEQAKFEEWSVKWKYNLRPANEGSTDTYMEGETETAWMGWMACVDSFAAPLADKTGGGE